MIGVNVNGFSESKILDGTVSDIDGIAKIRKYKYDSIFVNYIGFSEIVIHPVNNNYYKIKMRSGNSFDEIDYNSSFHFIHDKMEIRGNKLRDPRFKKKGRDRTPIIELKQINKLLRIRTPNGSFWNEANIAQFQHRNH